MSRNSVVDIDAKAPPTYSETERNEIPPDLSVRLDNLSLDTAAGLPAPDRCIAHLKLLEAFQQLRENVANQEGLFGIAGPPSDGELTQNTPLRRDDAQLRVREKRWAVYVARAVDRFTKWWDLCISSTTGGQPCGKLTCNDLMTRTDLENVALVGKQLQSFTADNLPPLDVLMVWHAYLLNPRCFFEDCFRYGKMDFYATNFPWQAISRCIDSITFEYKPSAEALKLFEAAVGLRWDNLEDPLSKALPCSNCGSTLFVPWTKGTGFDNEKGVFEPGSGYADAMFSSSCTSCGIRITHEYLKVQRFRQDVQELLLSDVPLPGTVAHNGKPEPPVALRFGPRSLFPSRLAKDGLRSRLLEATHPTLDSVTMDDIKGVFEKALEDRSLIKSIGQVGNLRGGVVARERIAVRRMMSRYWYNSSPFALDLTGAVIRQGTFIEKMHSIDWLHSPALRSTMERLITKYTRFIKIMVDNPSQTAVPTLDVDLAWHTHQLSPQSYYAYTDKRAHKLIDHDDKIEETKLSDAFAWTSKAYEELYGEPYSECTCWYCEAIRESHSSRMDRLFKPSKKSATAKLHATPDASTSDPLKSPHISAHNAVRDSNADEAKARVKAAELDRAYHKACAKARKKGRTEPTRDEYMYAYAWGYPLYMPMYPPFAVDPCIGGGAAVYAADPCAVNTTAGVYGSCAAGTCGGMAAAGGAACAAGGSLGGGAACSGGGAACGGGTCGGGGGGCGGGGGS